MLLDLEMRGMDGVEAGRQLRASDNPAQVLVLKAFDTDDRILAAVAASVLGYLLKGALRTEIFEAIRVVSAGGALIPPVVVSKIAPAGPRLAGARSAHAA